MFVKTELRILIEFKKLCNGQRKRQVSLELKQNKTNKQTNVEKQQREHICTVSSKQIHVLMTL